MKIESKELIKTLNKWQREASPHAGLKEAVVLQKVINEVNRMAANEEIKQRIEVADRMGGVEHDKGNYHAGSPDRPVRREESISLGS